MKRGRILSLFLSIVLLISVIVPCLQMSVNADAANAISEIKAAWNDLKTTADNTTPAMPAELSATNDLLEAIYIAEDAIGNDAYAEDSKVSLQTKVNEAWVIVKNDENLLIKAMQQGWVKLIRDTETVRSIMGYNKTGLLGHLSIGFNQSGDHQNHIRDDQGNSYNDSAHSGAVIPTDSVTQADKDNFADNYVELRYEDPDVVGTPANNYSEDIPAFMVGDSLVTNSCDLEYNDNILSLGINILSTKKVKIGCRVWYVPAGGGYAATRIKDDIVVNANELYTFDLKTALNDRNWASNPVGKIDGVLLYIKEIDGTVDPEDDYIKFSGIIGSVKEKLPSDVSGDVSLETIYNKASTLDMSEYADNSAKERFQDLVNAAKALISQKFLERFEDKEELIKVVTEELWTSLTKKEIVNFKRFTQYNSSGDLSWSKETATPDGLEDRVHFTEGVDDAKSSGNTNLITSTDEQRKNYGEKYIKLTTEQFENGDTALNADKSNDIPYLDVKHSVVLTDEAYSSTVGLNSLYVNVNSSMPMELQYRIWYGVFDQPDKENASTARKWTASGMIPVTIKKGINKIDLGSTVHKYNERLANITDPTDKMYKNRADEVIYITIGIKSMNGVPDESDYLEIGSVLSTYNEVLPDELKGNNITAIKLYDAMQKLDMDDYVDGENKDNFILAMAAAKEFSDEEWAAIYSDEEALTKLIKEDLWPKLVKKTNYRVPFNTYNSSGNRQYFSEAINGTADDVKNNESGRVGGSNSDFEQRLIYGNSYCKLTTTQTRYAEAPSDRDIPYLNEKIVILTDRPVSNENAYNIKMSTVEAIRFNLKSSMAMSLKFRVWFYSVEDGNGNGKYDDWWASNFTIDIKSGLNEINLTDCFKKNGIKMHSLILTAMSVSEFEHTPTDSDYLEVGCIGYDEKAVVPKRLESINSLSAIVKEAKELNMDEYFDGSSKTMFINALNAAVRFLDNKDVNLSEHAPAEAYETDASGKRTKLGADKFGYEEQEKLYDGNTVDDPVVFDTKGKKIDIIFNLNDKMKLYDLRVWLKNNNVKSMKIYTAPVREAIWEESGFVYAYNDSTPDALEIGKSFSTPIEDQYVRFSFDEVVGDTLEITEIKCVGKGSQQLAYTNLIALKKASILDYAEVNYETNKRKYLTSDYNKSSTSLVWMNDPTTAFDGRSDTVCDFSGGSRFAEDRTTYNLVFNLGGLSAVDTIKYYSGSNPEYFPRHMRFYVGEDQMNILNNDDEGTVCVAEIDLEDDEIPEDGLYEANFLSQNANYVRIEFVEGGAVLDDGRYGDVILAVAKEVEIMGLSLNASKDDYVKSFTDEETGIIVNILKLSEGDIYETVQGMKLEKRKPTANEVEQANEFDFVFKDWFYTITFLDYRGDPVTDIDGREIRVSVPFGEDDEMESTYMATLSGDNVVLMENDILEIGEKFYISVSFDDPTKIKFAKGTIDELKSDDVNDVNGEEEYEEVTEEDEEEYEEDYEEDYDEDEEEEENEEEEEITSGKRKKYYKVIRRGGGLSTGAIVGIVSGSTVAVAGGALMIIFRKRIFKPRIRKPKV